MSSRIIRGPHDRIIAKDVFDAQAQASAIIAGAETRAHEIVAAAEGARAGVLESARVEGLARGRAEAFATIVEARRVRDAALADASRDIAETAMEVARLVLRAELSVTPDHVQTITAHVLDRARRAKDVRIYVHPNDVPRIEAIQDQLRQRTPLAVTFTIVADESVSEGGCLLRSDLGVLDARVETQLAAIEDALLVRPPSERP
jgi:flagellar biosynthesis/type III secretory pathway protein FliH